MDEYMKNALQPNNSSPDDLGNPDLDESNLVDINLDDINMDDINPEKVSLDDINMDDINPEKISLDDVTPDNDESGGFNIDLDELNSQLSDLNLDELNDQLSDLGDLGLDIDPDIEAGMGMAIPDDIAAQFFSDPAANMAMASVDSDPNSLDALINQALAREAASDFKEDQLSLSEGTLSVGRPAAVYDDKDSFQIDKPDFSSYKSKRDPHNIMQLVLGIPVRYMYAALGVVIIMLATTSFFGYTLLFGEESRRRSFELDGGVYLSQPSGLSNSAHQIFIGNGLIQLGYSELEIISAIFDSEKSLFTFSQPIDQSRLNFFIREENDVMRYIDLRTIALDNPGSVLHMQALTEGIRDFTLIVVDTSTGDEASLDFRFSQNFSHPPALYVDARREVEIEQSEFSLFLEDSAFSPTATFISYAVINDTTNPHATFGFNPALSLREGIGTLRTVSELTASFDNGNVILGALKAQPLRNLTQPIELTFSGLNRQYALNLELPVAPLLNRGNPPTDIPIGRGQYSMFLEGMIHSTRDNMFVLVFNTQDQLVPLPYEAEDLLEFMDEYRYDFRSEFAAMNAFFRRNGIDPYFNRVETIMTAYLLVNTPFRQLRIPGRAYHGRRGSDVIFDLSDLGDAASTPHSGISLLIESVELVREPVVSTLDMPRLSTSPNPFNEIFFADITEQFMNRLRYKSGEINRSQLGSFDERVFTQPADFQRIYAPSASVGEAIFNAQILAGIIHSNRMYAIVRETWQSGPLDPLGGHLLTYKVYAEQDPHGRWVITHNEIID